MDWTLRMERSPQRPMAGQICTMHHSLLAGALGTSTGNLCFRANTMVPLFGEPRTLINFMVSHGCLEQSDLKEEGKVLLLVENDITGKASRLPATFFQDQGNMKLRTPRRGILIAASLAISHWVQKPNIRPFLVYDTSISYINPSGDKVQLF